MMIAVVIVAVATIVAIIPIVATAAIADPVNFISGLRCRCHGLSNSDPANSFPVWFQDIATGDVLFWSSPQAGNAFPGPPATRAASRQI